MKPDSDDKRERVLLAAQECFGQYGFKRTSMEDIAQKADISRAALYLLFPNKEAIFRTLAERLHQAALERAKAALETKAPLSERLLAAFEGKMLELVELVQSSPHGDEIVDLNEGLGGDITQASEKQFRELLAGALSAAAKHGEITFKRIGSTPEQSAELLWLAAHGVKAGRPSIKVYRQRLAQLVQLFNAAVASGP